MELADGTLAVPVRDIEVFGEGSGDIISVRWMCNGSETSLLHCLREQIPYRIHEHKRDVGVHCYGKLTSSNTVYIDCTDTLLCI